MQLRIGALILQTQTWARARRTWQEVEASGVDVAYIADHLTHPVVAGRWWGDGWATLAAAAEVTERVELGPLVATGAVRRPTTLARAAATVNDISSGRFVLGLGAGSALDAAADQGVVPDASALAARFAEVVVALRALWDGEPEWQGEHVAFSGLQTAPLPDGARPPFLLLAAHGPRGLRLVAEHADGWSTYGGPKSVGLGGEDLWAVLERQSERLDRACGDVGRDPATLRRSVLLGFGPDRPLADVPTFVRTAERAARAGFDELVVYWPNEELADRFGGDPQVLADGIVALRP